MDREYEGILKSGVERFLDMAKKGGERGWGGEWGGF